MIEISNGPNHYIASELLNRHASFSSFSATNQNGSSVELRVFVNPPEEWIKFFHAKKSNLLDIKHPNIRKIYDIFFQDEKLYFILDEQSDADLESVLLGDCKLTDQISLQFATTLAEVLCHLMKVGLVYNPFTLKDIHIIGGQLLFDPLAVTNSMNFESFQDVPLAQYFSPELIEHFELAPKTNYLRLVTSLDQEKIFNARRSSFWSFGICLYIILIRESPFPTSIGLATLKKSTFRVDLSVVPKQRLSFDARNLIYRLLEESPTNRLSLETELLNHPILIKNANHKSVPYFKPPNKKMKSEEPVANILKKVDENPASSQGNAVPQNRLLSTESVGEKFTAMNSVLDSLRTDSMFSGSHSYTEEEANENKKSLLNENELPAQLGSYVFEKNVIVFLLDAAKKLRDLEELSALKSLNELICRSQILMIRRAFMQNHFILQSMNANINKFSLENFHSLCQTKGYQEFFKFYQSFQHFVKEAFLKMKYGYETKFTSPESLEYIEKIERLTVHEMNAQLGACLEQFTDFYVGSKGQMGEKVRAVFLQGVVYLRMAKEVNDRFKMVNFPKTADWVNFCKKLNGRQNQELEIILFGSK